MESNLNSRAEIWFFIYLKYDVATQLAIDVAGKSVFYLSFNTLDFSI